MYPAQQSLIPAQIALARFIENKGVQAISESYPFWYLGTTPFRFLTGPVIPFLLAILHKFVFYQVNLFAIFFIVLAIAFPLGAVGVYLLIRELGGGKRLAVLTAFFYLLGPIIPFLFPFSNGINLIAFSFLPYALILYKKFISKNSWKNFISCIIAITFIILIDSLIVTPLIVGMGAIIAITGFKKVEEKIKKLVVLLLISLGLVSVWYTPGYWWQVLISPSFAGKPLLSVISQLGQLLPVALAIGLAIVSDNIIRSKNKVFKFGFYWIFIYGFLTFLRFISDPDFFADWSAYGKELQLGLAILLSIIVEKAIKKRKIKNFIVLGFAVLYIIFSIYNFKHKLIKTMQTNIVSSGEYKIGKKLSQIVKPGEKVFLSGSSTFWLNSLFDISQVRGGNDKASVSKNWRQAAWEIREGDDINRSLKWLQDLKIDYLVIHTNDSLEFYHDYKFPDKFEKTEKLTKIYDEDGDRIYSLVK
ncbi:hypothetical protein ACFLZ1_03625 [Patescibacteria group bacterium]